MCSHPSLCVPFLNVYNQVGWDGQGAGHWSGAGRLWPAWASQAPGAQIAFKSNPQYSLANDLGHNSPSSNFLICKMCLITAPRSLCRFNELIYVNYLEQTLAQSKHSTSMSSSCFVPHTNHILPFNPVIDDTILSCLQRRKLGLIEAR